MVKNSSANAGDMGSIPGLGRFYMLWSNQARAAQLLSPQPRLTSEALTRYRLCSATRGVIAMRSLPAAAGK